MSWSGPGSSSCSSSRPENSASSVGYPVCLICFNFMFPRRLKILKISMGVGGKPWENHYLANIHKYPLDLCDPLEWVCLIKYIFPQNTWHSPNRPMLSISWELRTSCFLNHLTKKHRHLTIPLKLLPVENFPQDWQMHYDFLQLKYLQILSYVVFMLVCMLCMQ